ADPDAGCSAVTLKSEGGADALELTAKNPGSIGDTIRTAVTYSTQYPEATFNMEIFRMQTDSAGNRTKVDREDWKNLSMDPSSSSYAPTFLSQKSALVNATDLTASTTPGFSISGRVVPDGSADATFRTAWDDILGVGTPSRPAPNAPSRHKF